MAEQDQQDHRAAESPPSVIDERALLTNLGYRMLGSVADAEDVVQETYLRWYSMSERQRREIRSPTAWLVRVASRICLDVLGSARARRERYVGEWLPEPLPDRSRWTSHRLADAADPADRVTLDESVTMALLVVLDRATPAERVAFILHDVFRYPFGEIADIVGRTPEACRQLASSARRRIRSAQAPATHTGRHAEVVAAFRAAWETGDLAALVAVLDPDATAIVDGGGLVSAALDPIEGAESIAGFFLGVLDRQPGLTVQDAPVNGQPGLVAQAGGAVMAVIAVDVAGDVIRRIWAVRNPDKLGAWT